MVQNSLIQDRNWNSSSGFENFEDKEKVSELIHSLHASTLEFRRRLGSLLWSRRSKWVTSRLLPLKPFNRLMLVLTKTAMLDLRSKPLHLLSVLLPRQPCIRRCHWGLMALYTVDNRITIGRS